MLIVDTDVLSMIFREDTRRVPYLAAYHANDIAVSFMTLAETERWKIGKGWGMTRRIKWERFSQRFVVIQPNEDTCRIWAEVIEGLNAKGHSITDSDAWIAATAIEANCPLMTNNTRHFRQVDRLQLWQP